MKMKDVMTVDPRMEVIKIGNYDYITTNKLYRDIGSSYVNLANFHKNLAKAETWSSLCDRYHILFVGWNKERTTKDFYDNHVTVYPASQFGTNSKLESVLKSNGYNDVIFITSVAQKAFEHHIKETAPQAVKSATENAMLAGSGIQLDLLMSNPFWRSTLQAASEAAAAQKEAQEAKQIASLVKEQVDLRLNEYGIELEGIKSLVDKRPDRSEVGITAKATAMKVLDGNRDFDEETIKISDISKHVPQFKGIAWSKISPILDHYGHKKAYATGNDAMFTDNANYYNIQRWVREGLEEVGEMFWSSCNFNRYIASKGGREAEFSHVCFGYTAKDNVRAVRIKPSVNKFAQAKINSYGGV
jgi:hypothetical protein